MSELMKKLRAVQAELKAPKNQKNTFGNYNYRSAEDILEAVKQLLNKYELTMIISDEVVNLGDRYYVKATATVNDDEGNHTKATGMAREAFDKKGMDDAQITGSASSYARKYALNGLFNIDDTKDADTNEYVNNAKREPAKPTQKQLDLIHSLASEQGMSDEEIAEKLAKVTTSAIASATIEKLKG